MKEIILSEKEIKNLCKNIAKELENKFKGSKSAPVFIGVLKGSTPFFMDLLKHYKKPCKIDFMECSSYHGTSSTGVIHLTKDVNEDIKNKDIVIVEDVVDTGLTINYLKQYLQIKYQPKSICVVCLIDKKALRRVEFDPDIVGVTLRENKFLLGYGLDYKGYGRNIPYIYVPETKEIEKYDKLD